MLPLIILGAIALVPVLAALILRVHATFVFVAIAVGYFLQQALSDDVDLALATIVRGSDSMVIARLVLLFVPVILTLFVLRKSQGKSGLFQLMPLLFSGLALAILTLPLLPAGIEQGVYDSEYGTNIKGATDLIVTAASISNLVLVYMLFKPGKDKHSKHH